MKVDRVYLNAGTIVVVIKGREGTHLPFRMETITDTTDLIQKIKAKIVEIDSAPPATPEIDWQPFYQELKAAIEGTNIGA